MKLGALQKQIYFYKQNQQHPAPMRASKLQNSRSRSPASKSPNTNNRRRASSPSPVKLRPTQESIVAQMKQSNLKLYSNIEAHLLVLHSNAPMRCLEHDSVLSLYCETEQRLLCASCVFRNGGHRLHKVFPMEKYYPQISRDVDQMARLVQREVYWAQGYADSIYQFIKTEETHAGQAIVNLAKKYEQLQLELYKGYEEARLKIISQLESTFGVKQPLLMEIDSYKEIYAKNKPAVISIDPEKPGSKYGSQNELVFSHVIGTLLCDNSRNKESQPEQVLVSRIKQIEKRELDKIKDLEEIIQRWKVFSHAGH